MDEWPAAEPFAADDDDNISSELMKPGITNAIPPLPIISVRSSKRLAVIDSPSLISAPSTAVVQSSTSSNCHNSVVLTSFRSITMSTSNERSHFRTNVNGSESDSDGVLVEATQSPTLSTSSSNEIDDLTASIPITTTTGGVKATDEMRAPTFGVILTSSEGRVKSDVDEFVEEGRHLASVPPHLRYLCKMII
jgi:hypothetical protein